MIPRRDFLRRSLYSGAALASLPLIGAETTAAGAAPAATSETVVKTLYDSLTDAQRQALVFDFENPLRTKISNNWHITEQRIGSFLNADQNAMVREIFLKAHSEEYAETVLNQVTHDSGKAGFGDSSIAMKMVGMTRMRPTWGPIQPMLRIILASQVRPSALAMAARLRVHAATKALKPRVAASTLWGLRDSSRAPAMLTSVPTPCSCRCQVSPTHRCSSSKARLSKPAAKVHPSAMACVALVAPSCA